MEVLLLPDPTSRLVTSVVIVMAGSNREDPRISGASHFLEHMLFNGTDRRTQNQLYNEEDAAGGFNNAFTRRTHAAYMMTMPADRLNLALDLQTDMLFHSRIPGPKFEKERGIILEELEKDRENPSYELRRMLQLETYPQSSYGLPVLGTEHSIRELERREIYAHYKRLYVPENMAAILLGGFDPQKALALLDQSLGKERPTGAWTQAPPSPAPIRADRIIRHSMELSASRVRVIWNGPDPGEAAFLALQVAADLMIGDTSSPLGRALEKRFPGSVISCYGSIEAGPGFGRLIVDADLQPGTALDDVCRFMRETVPHIEPPDESRIAGWKVSQRAQQIFARQRSYMFAPFYSEVVALQGLWGLETRLLQIGELAAQEVRSAAQRLARGPSWAILVESCAAGSHGSAGGMPEGIPGATPPGRPGAMPGGTPDAKTSAMPGGTPDAKTSAMPGGTPDAKPGAMPRAIASDPSGTADENLASAVEVNGIYNANAIHEESTAIPCPIHDSVLSNGVHVIHVGAPDDGSLSIYVLIEGRNYLEPKGKEGITELLHRLLSTGAGDWDESQLDEVLARIGGDVQTADNSFIPFDDYYTRRDFSFIRFQALAEFSQEACDLLGKMLREPRFEKAVVERERSRVISRLQRDAVSARRIAGRELWRLLLPEGHPEERSPYGTTAGLEQITLQDLRAHHRRLLDPRRIWIAIVSSAPTETVRAWAEGLLPPSFSSDSPTLGMSPEGYATWLERDGLGEQIAAAFDRVARTTRPGSDTQAGGPPERSIRWLTGGGTRGYVLEALLLPEHLPAAGSAAVATAGVAEDAYRVATSLLSSRLAFRLREEQGMAYSIGASVKRVGSRALYIAGAGTRKENLGAMAGGFVRVRAKAMGTAGAEEIRRTASKIYGRSLRRQEVRLNQAMYSVWAARDGQESGAWWRQAEQCRRIPEASVAAALDVIARAESSVLIVVE
ncbi:MAG: insulinase family protein [Candidatus Eisenbacteria sp.]|nr:insulinase family protein [Candidatus Eisenbacteria bacterium]